MISKQSIREDIFRKRREVSDQQVIQDSQVICQKVMAMPEYQDAKCIYVYMDFNHEVSTRTLIEAAWKAGKKVAAPRVEGRDLRFYEVASYNQLEPSDFHVPEPVNCPLVEEEEALLIVPGVAFDESRHRVGYGQGFYDRYLSEHTRHKTVAVAFEFQIVQAVPFDTFDILPEVLISERRTL